MARRSGGMIGLDLFGGCGRVAARWRQKHAGSIMLDVNGSVPIDLTNAAVQKVIFGWIRARRIHFIMLAPPRNSWSRASNAPPHSTFPAALRSNRFIMGLHGLSALDQRRVFIGNIIMRFVARVLHLCVKFGIPACAENPL